MHDTDTLVSAGLVTWRRIRIAAITYAALTSAATILVLTGAAPAWLTATPTVIAWFGAIPTIGLSFMVSAHIGTVAGHVLPSRVMILHSRRVRQMLDSPLTISLFHDGTNVIEASRGFAELFGAPQSEIIDTPVRELFDPPETPTGIHTHGGRGRELHATLIAADGRELPIQVDVRRGEWEGGSQWLVTIVDLSRNAVIEEALEHNLMFHTALINTIPNPLFFKNVDGVYIDCNNAFADFFGRPKERIVGSTVFDLLPAESADHLASVDSRAMNEDRLMRYETSVADAEGRTREVIVNLAPFRAPSGEAIGLVGIQTDITERKAMERALTGARLAAEEGHRAKSRFLAHITHQFRTPLNAILGYVRLVEESARDDEARKKLKIAQVHGEQLLGLIDNLLQLSRLESGRLTVRSEPFSIIELMNEVVGMFQAEAGEKGLELLTSANLSGSDMVQGDENHVRHILENLVENAIKYTEKGTVAVGAYPEAEPETITFIVSDTGMGIPPNRRESIFSPFDRADQDRTATKGTGLGLAICRELATLLGGDVVLVESSPGGSVFRLSLPLRRIEAKSPAPPDTRDPDRVARDASLQAAESIESAAPVSERLQPPDEAIPPIDDIQKLRQIARKGDIAALSEHAERGLRGDPRFATFYGTLARYASQFEIQKIRELIDAVHSQR